MKPKIGNAALIFANEAPRSGTSFSSWLGNDRWAKHICATALLFAIVGTVTVVVAQTSNNPSIINTQSTPTLTPPNHVEVVRADGKSDQLVGTLIRGREGRQDGYTAINATQSQTLTAEERARLLHIISN